jgi:hypothetical protein
MVPAAIAAVVAILFAVIFKDNSTAADENTAAEMV